MFEYLELWGKIRRGGLVRGGVSLGVSFEVSKGLVWSLSLLLSDQDVNFEQFLPPHLRSAIMDSNPLRL